MDVTDETVTESRTDIYVEPWRNASYTSSDLQKLRKVRLVTGRSHPELAAAVSKQLRIPLTDMGVGSFSNTETRINPTREANSTFRGKRVFVLQTGSFIPSQGLTVNDTFMETLLIIDACVRGGCKEVVLLMPHYPYARQDKKDSSRAPISAALVGKILKGCALARFVSMDLHNPAIQGYFPKCSDNLFTTKLLREFLMRNVFHATQVGDPNYTNKFVLIAPDAGAAPKVEKIAGYLALDFLTMNKTRDYNTKNKVKTIQLQCAPEMLNGRTPRDFLAGKKAIIVDDMADTFGTVLAAIEKLLSYGVESCLVAVTHGVLSGEAIERINGCSGLEMVIVSDTLPQAENVAKCPKLRVYSIDWMLAEVVRRTVCERSFGTLMED